MAAPPTTERQAPAGIPLTEGYQILVAFAQDPDISFWEKTIKLPGVDMGDFIDISTQHNLVWIPMVSRALKALTEYNVVGSFDPNAYNQFIAIAGVNDGVTIHLPDGSTIDHWGAVKKVEGPDAKKGEQPDMTVTVQPTNWDPDNFTEAGPVITSVAGT